MKVLLRQNLWLIDLVAFNLVGRAATGERNPDRRNQREHQPIAQGKCERASPSANWNVR